MFIRVLKSVLAVALVTMAISGRATTPIVSPAVGESASGSANSQPSGGTEVVQEPEYNNEFYYFDSSTKAIAPLEKAALNNKVKARALGFGGVKQTLQVATPSSSFRLKANASLAFVVRGVPTGTNPADVIKLLKFTVGNNQRELFMASAGIGGLGAKYRGADEGTIQFTATKYATNSVKIIPVGSLEPGEYVLVMAPASSGPGPNVPSHGFCFAVDPP